MQLAPQLTPGTYTTTAQQAWSPTGRALTTREGMFFSNLLLLSIFSAQETFLAAEVRGPKEMSQREGAPQSTWSAYLLSWTSWLLCLDSTPNEWQQVWYGRNSLHHDSAPRPGGRYTGHSYAFTKADMVMPELAPSSSTTASVHASPQLSNSQSKSFGTNGFDN